MAALARGAAVTRRTFGNVLLRRARSIGERRAEIASEQLAQRINETIAGVTAQTGRSTVRLRGRGLAQRWITDAALRWLGRLLR